MSETSTSTTATATVPAVDDAAAKAAAAAAAEEAEKLEDAKKTRMDILSGVTLAMLAASLAICDLGAGKFGDDEILLAGEKSQAYSWFQSKSMKQTLAEGEAGLLTSLLTAEAIAPDKVAAVTAHTKDLEKKAAKHELQKNEILLGSKAVGEANWAQDVDGKMGQITGAKEFEFKGAALGKAGDVFDLATLFLQLCLVMGAIGIVMQQLIAKKLFYGTMVVLGLAGTVYTYQAYMLAWATP